MSEPKEWWESFWPAWADVQRQVKSEEETRAEADCIEDLLELPPQSSVLDVPCGEGRLSLAVASLGYRVTGVDITLPLLEDARRKAAASQLEIVWEHRDMRDLPWEGAFHGAFCFWGSFGYFDEGGNAAFLKAVSRALKPGARFLIDTHTLETVVARFQERGWSRVGDILMLEERRYDHARSRIDVEWTWVRNGGLTVRQSSMRIYTYSELCRLLEETGFQIAEAYDGLSDRPFHLGARRLLMVASKRG
jgi:cyclopropane fatty-acyl-phospholipid synthase-like methyltransferase